MSTKFAFCFPTEDGNVVCKHRNGDKYIVFPGLAGKEKTKLMLS